MYMVLGQCLTSNCTTEASDPKVDDNLQKISSELMNDTLTIRLSKSDKYNDAGKGAVELVTTKIKHVANASSTADEVLPPIEAKPTLDESSSDDEAPVMSERISQRSSTNNSTVN